MTRKRLLQPKWSTSVLCVQSCLQRSFELGNMMLVGPQCTGRTSAARLAAQQQDMEAVVLHSKPSLAAKSTPSTAGLLDQVLHATWAPAGLTLQLSDALITFAAEELPRAPALGCGTN